MAGKQEGRTEEVTQHMHHTPQEKERQIKDKDWGERKTSHHTMTAREQQAQQAHAPAVTGASAAIDDPKPDRPLPAPTPTTTTSPAAPFQSSFVALPKPFDTLTPDSLADDAAVGATDAASRSPSDAVGGPNAAVSSAGHRPSLPIMSPEASLSASASASASAATQSASSTVEAPVGSATDGAADASRAPETNPADDIFGTAAEAVSLSPASGAHQFRQSPDHRIAQTGAATQPQTQPLTSTSALGRIITAIDTTSPSTNPSSPPFSESPPIRTGSVLPDTRIAHPKPIAVPVSASNSISAKTPVPDHTLRLGCPVGNVAQLEATAERLSTGTSSIGDAIRDLHGELKRSDSRRSSKLAASMVASQDDLSNLPPVGQLKRHISNASSIVSTNIAARHGGYSPAGFIMSPNHSLSGRLRSGSNRSSGRPEVDVDTFMSRHGPGKSSVRSVRSAKMSLAEISESEPISLDKAALDAADMAPPLEDDNDSNDADTMRIREQENRADLPSTDAFHQMLDSSFAGPDLATAPYTGTQDVAAGRDDVNRARAYSTYSHDSLQDALDAFVDFDGVHCEPESEWDLPPPPPEEDVTPEARPRLSERVRPQSYFDPETGQKMLYYPARVPAMLNLPPKLSSAKPSPAQRDHRRSQVMSVMAGAANAENHPDGRKTGRKSHVPDMQRDSWLPDPLANHRESFMALPQDEHSNPQDEIVAIQTETPAEPDASMLRRPQRLSRSDADNRKSRQDNLPAQLRASAFFDLPSKTHENLEIKNGSAMATLEGMLDASMNAPVDAFTDHSYAGKLGSEVYGKEKKRRSKLSLSMQSPPTNIVEAPAAQEPKKRSSFMWFKRSSHQGEASEAKSATIPSQQPGGATNDVDGRSTQRRGSSDDGDSVPDRDGSEQGDEKEGSDDDEDDQYDGPPTTLLAELQLRKKQQKQRTQLTNKYPHGMHATLLEMDAVAEVERQNRKNKRVNLAWEDPRAHYDQNGSDDEDVPLAVIAAKHHGAKNLADLERPLGLMEKREMEDNEPLSHRRARLQGQQEPSFSAISKRQSLAVLSARIQSHIRAPSVQMPKSPALTPDPEPVEEEIEEETLGDRKRRLESKELPRARPVSSSFSAELLSQFGDIEGPKDAAAEGTHSEDPTPAPEDETLGQRRRRLQAEREAREREMSYGNLVGEPVHQLNKRLSMADILAAHPKKENDGRLREDRSPIEQDPSREAKMAAMRAQMLRETEARTLQERHRQEQDAWAKKDREAKMAIMRQQMPTELSGPYINRPGGFHGGMYNDGRGGFGNAHAHAAQSTPHLATQPYHYRNHSSATLSTFAPMQQAAYAPGSQVYGQYGHMGGYNANNLNIYNPNAMQMQMPMQPQMQVPASTGSMSRVEQWRHGVVP